MDSLTQAVLGASVAAVCAPARDRRAALLVGAALGTLPDLDVLVDYGDAVANFTRHRSFSHSLFVLGPVSLALWWALRRWWAPVRAAPGRWLGAIALALITHPLLDGHTAYGTQLFWPMHGAPVMWSTVFIIDPLYTLPLLVGVVAAEIRPTALRAQTLLRVGLVLSTAYLGWTWVAKSIVERRATAALAPMGLADAPRFSTPAPFTSLLWRVVVQTRDQGYLEGLFSLPADRSLRFERFPSEWESLAAATDVPAVARLRWFSQDFLGARVEDGRLVLDDLRMGQEPKYVFSHVVAARTDHGWEAVPTELLPVSFTPGDFRTVWNRLWGD